MCNGDQFITYTRNGCEYAKPCKCREEELLKNSLSFANIPLKYKDMRLNSFTTSVYKKEESIKKIGVAVGLIKQYLNNFDEMKSGGKGLYISSEIKGSGKTRMAASLANDFLHNRGIRVKFATSTTIIQEIKESWQNRSEGKLLSDLAKAEILIIDDFGTETIKKWIDERFYQVINERYDNKKITIYTSNYKLRDLPYGDRIVSRISESALSIDFPEEDIRQSIGLRDSMQLLKRMDGDLS